MTHDNSRNDRESYERFLGRWTHIGQDMTELSTAVRQDLTQSLGDILPVVQDELRLAFAKEMGNPEQWTTITVYPTILKIVALLSGRVFVGAPLSRSPAWLDASIREYC